MTAVGALLLVNTSNGADHPHKRVPSPNAPSFIALDKLSGKLIWADNSPGNNILDGQWSSPAAAVLGGVPQAIFPGGDGWVYSFRAAAGVGGKPELLWKFDTNPKKARSGSPTVPASGTIWWPRRWCMTVVSTSPSGPSPTTARGQAASGASTRRGVAT